ncbi:tetratricopeptide repeat protein [Prochlorothrix hollandica]|uniref:tetratricopeptide repeat protein n=1 Tax=Prochlorothrix hollandica TaxID=1223 RepID=UPI00034B1385|nr:tetratricopeptide repeat protein [Prochlorothrix hollandica]
MDKHLALGCDRRLQRAKIAWAFTLGCWGCLTAGLTSSLTGSLTGGLPAMAQPTGADYRLQGLARRQQGDLGGAIAALQQAVALEPDNVDGQVLLGWTLHLAGEEDQAAAVLAKSLRSNPVHVPSLNALGIVYLVDGQLWRAVATHSQAVLVDPDNEIGFYNLSLALERLELFPWAIATAEAAWDREPQNPHAPVALALARWGQGDQAGAVAAYGQALALDDRYGDGAFLAYLTEAGFSGEQIDRSRDILNAVERF